MEINRRNFIKKSFAAGTLTMGLTPFLSACGRGISYPDPVTLRRPVNWFLRT